MPTITLKIELLKPTKQKQEMYILMTQLNTQFANWLLDYDGLAKASSSSFKLFTCTKFPSAVSCETVRIVKSQIKNQGAKQYKRLWCGFNNQNLRIEKNGELYTASFPTLEKRIGVPVITTAHQIACLDRLLAGEAKLGTSKLMERKGKWYLLIALSWDAAQAVGTRAMGIDVGLKNIAVASIGTHNVFYSGAQAAYMRRRYFALRKKLGKAKALAAIKRIADKEARWMKNQNHLVSRRIVNLAIAHGVVTIAMEDLKGIRRRTSRRKAGRNLHAWAFDQLQQMIEYKAGLAGIAVQYVDPSFTSQTCKCGHVDKHNRRGDQFKCTACGYSAHADANASINIATRTWQHGHSAAA